MSIRHMTALMAIIAMIDAQHGVEANAILNSTEMFGADAVKEMPMMSGVGLSRPNLACRSTFGAIALTPKAFRLYVFKESESVSQATVEAHSMQQSREISLGTDQCQMVAIVSRSVKSETGKLDLAPGAGSGVPGGESSDVLDERNMFVTGAYFPSTNVDCGSLNTTFQFDQYGLMILTNLINGFSISSKLSSDHSFRTLTFTHGDCSTKVDFHFYNDVGGKPSQLNQR